MKTIMLSFLLAGCSLVSAAQHKQAHDAAEDKYGEPGKQQLGAWMQNMQGKVEPEYNFKLGVKMHITTINSKDEKKESDMHYHFNNAKNLMGFEMKEEKKKKSTSMFMIYDWNANTMITLDQNEKTGMAINMNAFMSKEMQDRRTSGTTEKKESRTKCKKTGKTKTILGYSCEEYVCTDEERGTRSEFWVTNKVSGNMARTWQRGPYAGYAASLNGMAGMMLEGNFYKNDKLETTMLVTELNEKEDLTIKTAEYKFPDLGGAVR